MSFPWEGETYYPSLIHCGIQEHEGEPRKPAKAHDHNVYHILLFLEGYGNFLFNERSVPVASGLFLLCPPGLSHSFQPQNEGRVKYIELTFEYVSRDNRLDFSFDRVFSVLFNTDIRTRYFYMLDKEGMNRFRNLHNRLYNRLVAGKGGGADYEVDLGFLDIMLFVLDLIGKEERLSLGKEKGWGEKIGLLKELIHNGFPAKFSLDDASRELGLSKSYMIKRFKEKYGQTPVDYDRRLRINVAADLIVSTNRTLEDIAQSLGFCDVFYFIKTFKKYKGVTPGRYA